MKRLFLLVIGICFLLSACALNLPSKCEQITEPSMLCQMAEEHQVRLEDIGNILIVANAVAIGEGLYTREQAIEVMMDLKYILENPVSYLFFKGEVEKTLIKYPGLFEVAQIYMTELTSPQIMYSTDREMLSNWLGDRIAGLEAL